MYRKPIINARLINERISNGIYPFELTIDYFGKKKKIDGYYETTGFKETFQIDSQFAVYLAPSFNAVIKSNIRSLVNDFVKNHYHS